MKQASMSEVHINLYDFSCGLAAALSEGLVGHRVEGVWQCSVVVFGLEYVFSNGVCEFEIATLPLGKPAKTIALGVTRLSKGEFRAALEKLAANYAPGSFSMTTRNCNHFANELTRLLLGRDLPPELLRSEPYLCTISNYNHIPQTRRSRPRSNPLSPSCSPVPSPPASFPQLLLRPPLRTRSWPSRGPPPNCSSSLQTTWAWLWTSGRPCVGRA